MKVTILPRRLAIALVALVLAAAACGANGPITAGPITVADPPASTVPPTTAVESPDPTSPTDGTTPTTAPVATTPDDADGAPVDDSGSDSEDGTGDPSRQITVYFIDDSGAAIPTSRAVTTAEVARAAIEAIVSGPNTDEAAAGLATALPGDTLILGLTISDGTAVLDLSREAEAGGGSAAMLGRLAQVVYTLTEFPSVERVKFMLDGQEAEYFSGEGISIADPLTRADFTSAVPIGEPIGSGSVAVWGQEELPAVSQDDPDLRLVVLVAGDDTLNVRSTPGTDGRILGELEPGVAVGLAGDEQTVGSSTWVTVATPAGPGWVNAFYLNEGFAPDPGDPVAVASSLASRFASGDDFSELISERGLWVSHHASPLRFRPSELDALLDSDTTYRWGSNALEPDSPELRARTFYDAIADRFVDAYFDDDTMILPDEAIEGPNGRPVQFAVPVEFQGFEFITVFDPGDDPQYGGLDWTGWIVSLALEDGEYKVIGLTIDEWSP